MIATIIPFRRQVDEAPAHPVVVEGTEAERLTLIEASLKLQRDQLINLIAGLRASPAASINNDLGAATANLSSAACFALVQVELMLHQARGLERVVRA